MKREEKKKEKRKKKKEKSKKNNQTKFIQKRGNWKRKQKIGRKENFEYYLKVNLKFLVRKLRNLI